MTSDTGSFQEIRIPSEVRAAVTFEGVVGRSPINGQRLPFISDNFRVFLPLQNTVQLEKLFNLLQYFETNFSQSSVHWHYKDWLKSENFKILI